ncbi:hypothetical protein AOQ84DRAFT_377686 [Glonium stellatum]|uniref:Uncharacterized protein n=1 Tax=Glonium stellatum TaxID=574774 RepID=A0A8E2EZD3_9PEZI|nr:hypothetical protein AOQ84DRAFT_377686 [Glonium stellatum]
MAEGYAQRDSGTTPVPSNEFEQRHSKRRRLDTHNQGSVYITPAEATEHEQCYARNGSSRYDRWTETSESASIHGGVLEWSTAGSIPRETLPDLHNQLYSSGGHQCDQTSYDWGSRMCLQAQCSASGVIEELPRPHISQDATQVCSTNGLFQSYDYDTSIVSLYNPQHPQSLSNHEHITESAHLPMEHQSRGVPSGSVEPSIACPVSSGQITGIPAQFTSCNLPHNISRHPAQFLGGGKFSLKGMSFVEGVLDPREAQILYLFDDVGDFFQIYELYLQDPIGCDRNVRYCNPHRLSSLDEEAPMTFDLDSVHQHMHVSEIGGITDLLEGFNAPIDLPESEPPAKLVTSLLPHQKQALYFMVNRERGWAMNEPGKDVWNEIITPSGKLYELPVLSQSNSNHVRYMNNISGKTQTSKPPDFCGGILADPMGLGKSLSMISLIANDSSNSFQNMSNGLNNTRRCETGYFTNATLLIVPLPLIPTWEDQFKKHLKKDALVIRRHHAAKRVTKKPQLDNCDVVITTYQTIESEWRKGSGSLLFSLYWRRIILDEAHCVRDHTTNTAKAVCSLHSVSRWAVTGTPLQNRLSDLATLFHFLRVSPYDDPKKFDADITQVWKSRQDMHAIERLKRLLQCILLRRSKSSIELPSRVDEPHAPDLGHEERALYEESKLRAVRVLDDALSTHSGSSFRVSYMNALQRINDLRLICNLGVYKRSASIDKISLNIDRTKCEWDSTAAQRVFDSLTTVQDVFCSRCSLDLGATEDDVIAEGFQCHSHLHFSRCLQIICSSCIQQFAELTNANISLCGHVPQCPVAPVSRGSFSNNSSNVSSPLLSELPGTQKELPTKIRTLISDLQSLQYGVKSVVFSYWRSTLDLIEEGLDQATISYVRFDGKVSPESRPAVLNKFRDESTISVILMTISCASVGLDITAASRAYIMEPQWNPTVEEQALARIHRMGQTKAVTTVRFIMKDSFEEHVLKVQHQKKELAELLLSRKTHVDSETSVSRLENDDSPPAIALTTAVSWYVQALGKPEDFFSS